MLHLGKRSWRPYAALSAALVSLAVVLSVSGSAGAVSRAAAPPRAAAVAPRASLIAPAGELLTRSSIRGLTSTGDVVTGTFKPLGSHVNSTGHLIVRGTLNMLVHSATPVRTSTTAYIPVKSIKSLGTPTAAAGTAAAAAAALPAACNVLNLVLGPLHLNLLGLVVDLNQVILNITAQPGPGNLLGNLLCAVAGLLDGTPLSGLLGQISTLLNSILAILNQ
jgi:hypothetical protein